MKTFHIRSGNTTYIIEAENIRQAKASAYVSHNVHSVDSWSEDSKYIDPSETDPSYEGGVQTRGEVDGDYGR